MFPSDPLELRGQDVAISVAHCAGAAPWTFLAFFHWGFQKQTTGSSGILIWLVVWNMAFISFIFPYVGNNHPIWRTHIFQRGWNHQPVIIYFMVYVEKPSIAVSGKISLSAHSRTRLGQGISLFWAPWAFWRSLTCRLKHVIFHSYVSWPEGKRESYWKPFYLIGKIRLDVPYLFVGGSIHATETEG